jgi:hypothetical protein
MDEFPARARKFSVRTKKSLFREQQGIACKRFKSLNELTPDSAEMTGNFANSLLFSLLPGN